jgi:glycosyltransferase involved in cell wall biosynthesis
MIVQKDILYPELYISPQNEKILDFKQNMVGFVRFKGFLKYGETIHMSHGEILQNNSFFNINLRSAKQELKFIGDGEKRKSLASQSKNCSTIKFLGKLTDDELKAYYLAADIFCFPSITKNEAFGIALAEAMYFSLPSITYTIPGSGVNYVSLNGETGLEVPNRDVEAYANAIKELSADKDKRKQFGEKAFNRVIEKFLFNQFKKSFIDLIAE